MAFTDIALVLGVSTGAFLSGFCFRAWLFPGSGEEGWPDAAQRQRQYEPPHRHRDL